MWRESPDLVVVYESPNGRARPPLPPFATSRDGLRSLRRWYDAKTPCWLDIEPVLRRALILRSHRWIAERVLMPAADGRTPGLEDFKPGGSLERTLLELVRPDELVYWRPWIHLFLWALDGALSRPVTERDHWWVRSLFLLPLGIPAPIYHDAAWPPARPRRTLRAT
jgi:hypothetical protein